MKNIVKLLIADDNIYYTKNLINCITNELTDINITTNGKETLDIIKRISFDLILLDLNLSDVSGINIIREMQTLKLDVIPKIIIISEEINLINELKKDTSVINVIYKGEDFETICKKVQRYIKEIEFEKNKYEIRNKIIQELSYIGYNFKYKGSNYILEAILYAHTCEQFIFSDNLEKNIYKYVAYEHKTSINNIKTNIIRATNIAYTCQSEEIINNYFNLEIKMKPKDVINKVLSKIAI